MNPKELLEHFLERQEDIQSSIRDIVEIESPSFGIDGSCKTADWVENEFLSSSLEIDIERIYAKEYGEHLLVNAFDYDRNAKETLILGHTDTVHPYGSTLKNPTRIENGRLYGCGTFDMKANIVIMAEAFRAFKKFNLKPKRPIKIVLSCDEEVGSPTGRPLIEQAAANAEICLVFEPSANGRVKTGRKGTGMYTLKTCGIPSHAGLDPEKGASAILEIARQIEKIQALNCPDKGTTVNVCTIRGGTTSNVIPENASCEIDVRFTSIIEAVRIEDEIRKLKSVDERVTLELLGGINRPPMERTPAVAELYEKAKVIAAGFDYDLGETQVGGASDGNFVGAMGVPIVDGLGIAGDGAHTLQEYVLIEDIPLRATLVTLLMLDL